MVVNVNNKERQDQDSQLHAGPLVHIDGCQPANIPEYDGYYDQKLNTAFTIGSKITTKG